MKYVINLQWAWSPSPLSGVHDSVPWFWKFWLLQPITEQENSLKIKFFWRLITYHEHSEIMWITCVCGDLTHYSIPIDIPAGIPQLVIPYALRWHVMDITVLGLMSGGLVFRANLRHCRYRQSFEAASRNFLSSRCIFTLWHLTEDEANTQSLECI